MTTPTLGDRVHLIGIGGAGMSGIARILLARGVTVSGSDAKDSRTVLALRALGARVDVGHDGAHVPADATVVVSTAIRETNPELVAARERGLPVVHRAQALAALTAGRRVAAVAGTHGKTSTTSMLTVALQHCGLDPSFAIGGDLTSSGAGAHHGDGDIFVVEADESDGVVHGLRPGRRGDHQRRARPPRPPRHRAGLPRGVRRVRRPDPARRHPGRLHGRPGRRAARRPGPRTAGSPCAATATPNRSTPSCSTTSPPAQVPGCGPGSGTTSWCCGSPCPASTWPSTRWGPPWPRSSWAGTAACLTEGLAAFDGVRRRFEYKGRVNGVAVYDDYAHHPTEVEATLRAAREVAVGGRVVVAFQPHLYTRTRTFAGAFGAALRLADEVVVLDVYGAREDPEPGVTGALVANAVPLPPERVHYVPRWAEVPAVLAGLARPGDLVLTMGAGDVTVLGSEVLRELERAGEPEPERSLS